MNPPSLKFPLRSASAGALLLGLAVALTACGGGGSSGGTSASTTPSSGSASGFVSGFGSVVVDGVHYDDNQAQLERDDDSGTQQSAKPSDFKLGQHVDVEFSAAGSNATASKVAVSPEVVGSVTAVDLVGLTLTVGGQTVNVNTNATVGVVTVFEGYTDLSGVTVGDRIEVHGAVQGTGASAYILATRIEHLPASSGIASRVTGTVNNLASDGKRFQIGSTTVVVTSSTVITPASMTLANGQRVKVFSRTAIDTSVPSAPVMTADAIRIRGESGAAQSLMRVAGIVSQWQSAADFYVEGTHVNASGVASNLPSGSLDGSFVRVQGTYDKATGVLTASSVKIGRDLPRDSGIEVKGAITDFVSLDSFKVRNTAVQVVSSGSNATRFVGGSAADLANGVFVEIKGKIVNSMLVATTVEIKQPDASAELEIMGSIASIDTTGGTLTLNTRNGSQSVSFSSTTTSCDDNCMLTSLATGVAIKVEGYLKNGVLVAREISLLMSSSSEMSSGRAEDHGGQYVEIGGTLSAVTATQFTLNGLVVKYDASTVLTGGSALADGQRVEAKLVKQSSGDWYALTVKFKRR